MKVKDMFTYQDACEIARRELKECFEVYDKIDVIEIDEGWIFVFLKSGVELTPSPKRLICRDSGEVKCFSIPPISNLIKMNEGKKYILNDNHRSAMEIRCGKNAVLFNKNA